MHLLPALLRHITWEEDAVLAFLEGLLNIPEKHSEPKLTSLILGASFLLPFPRASLPTFPSFPASLLGLAFPSLALADAGAFPSTWAFSWSDAFPSSLVAALLLAEGAFPSSSSAAVTGTRASSVLLGILSLKSPPAIHGTGPWWAWQPQAWEFCCPCQVSWHVPGGSSASPPSNWPTPAQYVPQVYIWVLCQQRQESLSQWLAVDQATWLQIQQPCP